MMRLKLTSIRMDVFGKEVLVERGENAWLVYYVGAEGKKRPAEDIVIPAALSLSEIPGYVADLCHEWASPQHTQVKVIGSIDDGAA